MAPLLYMLPSLGFFLNIKNHQKTRFFEKLLNIYVNPAAGKRQSQ